MKALGAALIAVGALILVCAIVCAFAAIWVVGPDSGRLGGTSFVGVLVAALVASIGAMVRDLA